jgi:hypothetical protein
MDAHAMKTKLIITSSALLLIIVGIAIWLSQRDSIVVPDTHIRPLVVKGHSTQPRTFVNQSTPNQPPSDNPTAVGVLSSEAVASMKHVEEHMSKVFESASDDATGKRSVWFAKLNTWHKLLREAVQSKKRDDLFELVPIAAEFYKRDREVEPLAEPLDDLRFWMGHLGYSMITELGKVIAENDGAIDDRTASIAVTIFAVEGIQSDPWPEDERPPIDSAGVLISRSEVMQTLESLPIEQLSFFLRAQSADAFFRRYEQSGDGMPVLRQRYRENREALRSGFNSLASKVAAYQASTQAK